MIEAKDLRVFFRRRVFQQPIRALDGLSIQVEKGDIFGLLGPNGAGKSTAMYCFLGLIKPDQGEVKVFGETPQPGASFLEKVAYVPEEPHYHLFLTVREAVKYYSSLYYRDIPDSRISEVIETVALEEYEDLRLEKCSKGMKQKVGIAISLVNEPELIFLDEPTRGLDPLIVKEFRDILLDLNGKGVTVVLNSHILSEVEMVCNRVAIIDKGKVLVQDELKNLLKFDLENYLVEMDAVESLPPYFTEEGRTLHTVRGMVPVDKLPDLFRLSRKEKFRIYNCSLKKLSLEEAFFQVLHRGENN